VLDFRIATSRRRSTQKVRPNGKRAMTRVRLAARGTLCGQRVALVWCYPITGRRHQLRVHLSHSGFPILGDTKYGAAPLRAQAKSSASADAPARGVGDSSAIAQPPMALDVHGEGAGGRAASGADAQALASTPLQLPWARVFLHAAAIVLPLPAELGGRLLAIAPLDESRWHPNRALHLEASLEADDDAIMRLGADVAARMEDAGIRVGWGEGRQPNTARHGERATAARQAGARAKGSLSRIAPPPLDWFDAALDGAVPAAAAAGRGADSAAAEGDEHGLLASQKAALAEAVVMGTLGAALFANFSVDALAERADADLTSEKVTSEC
jgi:hypothetical protein